jgi:hypothetical protein
VREVSIKFHEYYPKVKTLKQHVKHDFTNILVKDPSIEEVTKEIIMTF